MTIHEDLYFFVPWPGNLRYKCMHNLGHPLFVILNLISTWLCNKTASLLTGSFFFLLHVVAFKEGKPGDLELNDLSGKVGTKWNYLGLRLGIGQDVLDGIKTNEEEDRPYRMLLHWRNTTSSDALYRDLYHALCSVVVCLNNVAKEFCCK